MMRFLKRLFGNDAVVPASRRGGDVGLTAEIPPGSPRNKISDHYFDTMSRMQTALSNDHFEDAVKLIRLNLRYIPDWVKETCRQYGSLEVSTIPALQQGGTILALVSDEDGLARMREIVASTVELEAWAENVERHQHDLRLFKMILDVVTKHPNCLQTEVKGLVGEQDGRRVANLISYLERAGRIIRIRKERTYELVLAGSPIAPKLPPKRIVGSHRTDRKSPELQEIDLSALNYVPVHRYSGRRR